MQKGIAKLQNALIIHTIFLTVYKAMQGNSTDIVDGLFLFGNRYKFDFFLYIFFICTYDKINRFAAH